MTNNIKKIREKMKVDGVISLTDSELSELRRSVNQRHLFKSEKVNRLLMTAFSERNFTYYDGSDDTKELDLQFYFEKNPAQIGWQGGKPVIEIKMLKYSQNKERYEAHLYRAIVSDGGYSTTVNTFGHRYQYITKIIARVFSQYHLLEIVKEELESKNKLQIGFYFFVIKREYIDRADDKFGIDDESMNSDIGVLNVMSSREYDEMVAKLDSLGLTRQCYVSGLFDYLTQSEASISENDWLNLEMDEEGRAFVSFIKD